jgi:hypothetical protein
MRFAALRARTGRFSRSCLAAGLDPGGFPRASTRYVCGAAAIPPCAANCRQPDADRESRSCHRIGQPVRLTRCRTPRRSPISRSLARVDAKKRPSNRSPPSLDMLETLLNRCIVACFGSLRDFGGDWVQVNVDRYRRQGFFIENCHALKPTLEKSSAGLVLAVGKTRQRLLQALHKPAQALQPSAHGRDPLEIELERSPSEISWGGYGYHT